MLCQICDSQTYVRTVTKIGVFEPTEILFATSAKESKLFYIIQENIQDTTFTFLDRKFWSERAGHDYVDRLAFSGDVEPIKIILGGNYYAACCFAAVSTTTVWLTRLISVGLKVCQAGAQQNLHLPLASYQVRAITGVHVH